MRTGYAWLVVLALMIVPGAAAAAPSDAGLDLPVETISVEPGDIVDKFSASPGHALVIEGDGPVVMAGLITTQPHPVPSAPGPAIIVDVRGSIILVEDASLVAADGMPGEGARGVGSIAGGDGGMGGSVMVHAESVHGGEAFIQAGSGGDGGDAFAEGDPSAVAIGGEGGDAGRIHLPSDVMGEPVIVPGDGGDGGSAEALGQHGSSGEECTEEDGEDDVDDQRDSEPVLGDGHGADAEGEPGACGPVDGQGGNGGHAEAYGGPGGTAEDGNGGAGGDAVAIGGRGGDGMDACFETIQAAEESGIEHAGNAGHGGTATAIGGDGGPGVIGGPGGFAETWTGAGDGGNATNPPIRYGNGGSIAPDTDREWGAFGGDGGPGVLFGGAGGGALGEGEGGNGGNHCGPLPVKSVLSNPVPSPSTALLFVLVLAVAEACKIGFDKRSRGR